jgi:hypothetical protein
MAFGYTLAGLLPSLIEEAFPLRSPQDLKLLLLWVCCCVSFAVSFFLCVCLRHVRLLGCVPFVILLFLLVRTWL